MTIGIVRGVLDRYPGLRSTWPLKQVSAMRQRQRWREQPRRMASWYRDMHDMRTRVCVSNLEIPEAPQLCVPVHVVLRVFDPDGAELAWRRLPIAPNGSLIVEVRDLLPASTRGKAASGQVVIDFEGPQLASSRAYVQWYNDRSLTSSHEKFGLVTPAVGGYWSVPSVQDSDDYRVWLAIVNLDRGPYLSDVTLKDDEGHSLNARVALSVNGSRFLALDQLFKNPRGFLHGQRGVLYFGNNHQPAMYYYFVENQKLGTWRAQHL